MHEFTVHQMAETAWDSWTAIQLPDAITAIRKNDLM